MDPQIEDAHGRPDPDPSAPQEQTHPLRAMALLAAGLLFALGAAPWIASAERSLFDSLRRQPPAPQDWSCGGQLPAWHPRVDCDADPRSSALRLPPGHPPLGAMPELPPGHPPIDRFAAPPLLQAPLPDLDDDAPQAPSGDEVDPDQKPALAAQPWWI